MPEEDTTPAAEVATLADALARGNRYHAFMRGYRHGAGSMAKCRDTMAHTTLSEHYAAGYETARVDITRASDAASERYGYIPSPLRTEGATP